MKTLFAVRHAMPCQKHRGHDHDRPLSQQGIVDCGKIGNYLNANHAPIDVMRSSTASRAKKTAHLLAGQIEFPVADIVENADWYLAPANVWLQVTQQLPEESNTAIIVGHNPGMCDFAKLIQIDGDYSLFPPLTVAILQLDIEFWGEATWGSAKLENCLYPDRL